MIVSNQLKAQSLSYFFAGLFLITFFVGSFLNWLSPYPYRGKTVVMICAFGFIAAALHFKALIQLKCLRLQLAFAFFYILTAWRNLGKESPLETAKTVLWILFFQVITLGLCFLYRQTRLVRQVLPLLFVGITTVTAAIGLISYYDHWPTAILLPNGKMAFMGYYNFRLFGLYIDPNFGAFWSVFALVLIFGFLPILFQKCWQKWIGYLLAVIHVLYLALSASRTGLLLFVLMGMAFILFSWRKSLVGKDLSKAQFCGCWQRWPRRVVLVLSIFVLSVFIFHPIGIWRSKAPVGLLKPKTSSVKLPTVQKNADHSLRTDEAASSQERLLLAREGLSLWLHRPLFGTTARGFSAVAKAVEPQFLLATGKVPHNAYVFLLLAGGLVAFGTLLAGAIWLWWQIVQVYRLKKQDLVFNLLVLSHILCLAFGMLFQDLFYTMSPVSFVFWAGIGLLLAQTHAILKQYRNLEGK